MRRFLAKLEDGGFTNWDLFLAVVALCVAGVFMFSLVAKGMISQYSRAADEQQSDYAHFLRPAGAVPSVSGPPSYATALAKLETRSMPSYGSFNSSLSPSPGPERVPECFPNCSGTTLGTL